MGGNTWFLVEQGGRGISRRLQSINGDYRKLKTIKKPHENSIK